MRIDNKEQFDDLDITTKGKTHTYYSTEWEYVEYDKDYIYIKFVESHPTNCIIYNKDQVISIEIG